MAQIRDDMIPYLTAKEIDALVGHLADQIERDFRGEQLVLICPLKGSFLFLSDLCRKIQLPQIIDFVSLGSTEIDSSNGDRGVEIIKDLGVSVTGRNVLIVEEIIDAGRKLNFLKNRVLASVPASLKIVCLLDKPARRVIDVKPDYIGKTIEDRFVVGYGMDDGELGRNYEDILYLKH